MNVETAVPLIREALPAPRRVMESALLARRDRLQPRLTGMIVCPIACCEGRCCRCRDFGEKHVAMGFLIVKSVRHCKEPPFQKDLLIK
jgi:hypothetical protein